MSARTTFELIRHPEGGVQTSTTSAGDTFNYPQPLPRDIGGRYFLTGGFFVHASEDEGGNRGKRVSGTNREVASNDATEVVRSKK